MIFMLTFRSLQRSAESNHVFAVEDWVYFAKYAGRKFRVAKMNSDGCGL